MEGEPIRDGALLIGHDGRIQAVGPASDVPVPAGLPAEHFSDCIILPGLINTHTHLELTGLAGAIHEPDFADWIRRIIALKSTLTYDHFLSAARRGVSDCLAAGVTTVADSGDSGAVIEALHAAGASGIAFQEVFGPHPDQWRERLYELRRRVEERQRFTSERVRIGVSPHAPYTVSGRLYTAVAEWARAERLPMATHLAESLPEVELFRDGTGSFGDMWQRRGIALPEGPVTPIAWLDRHGALGADMLCAHVVHAGGEDMARLARSGTPVAHCPRSNAAHRHGTAPLDAMLDAGINVGCGTDSVVSVGALDLLAEARAARRLAHLGPDAALALCTIGAARALGLDGEVGSLREGKWGDATVIEGSATSPSGAVESILASSLEQVAATFLAGRPAYRRNGQ